jgi:hypothetical protein
MATCIVMHMQLVNHFCAPVLQRLSLLTGQRILGDDAAGFAACTGVVCTFLLVGLMAVDSCFQSSAACHRLVIRLWR